MTDGHMNRQTHQIPIIKNLEKIIALCLIDEMMWSLWWLNIEHGMDQGEQNINIHCIIKSGQQ